MLNLSTLRASDHATITLKHPVTKEALALTWTLAGPASQEYATARQKLIASRSTADTRELSLDLLAGCVVGWEGMSLDGKTPLEFSQKKAREILADPAFYWIQGQLDDALVDVSNFITAC